MPPRSPRLLTGALFFAFLVSAPLEAQASFNLATTLNANLAFRSVDAGDLDGDQDDDLVVITEFPSGSSSVPGVTEVIRYINDGTGNLTPAPTITFSTFGANAGRLADVNGDLFPDLVMEGSSQAVGSSALIFVSLNDGSGGFGAAACTFVGTGVKIEAIGDLTGDGAAEIVVLIFSPFGGATAGYLLNDGFGGFSGPINLPGNVAGAAVADAEGDGDLDVYASSGAPGFPLNVLLNDGTGAFPVSIPLPCGTQGLVLVGDLNGEATPDVVVVGDTGVFTPSQFTVLIGTALIYAPPVTSVSPVGPTILRDMDGDTDVDVLMGTPSFPTLLLNDGLGNLAASTGLNFTPGPGLAVRAVTLDLENDGDPDLVGAGGNPAQVEIHRNVSPWLTLLGAPITGTTVSLAGRSPRDPLATFACGFSGAPAPGIVLPDSRVIPLVPDDILALSLSPTNPFFAGTTGSLDASGAISPPVQISIPAVPALVGVTLYAALVTLVPAAPSGVASISGAVPITFQ